MVENLIQKGFLSLAESFKDSWFSPKDEDLWMQWVNFERRGFDSLRNLLKIDVRVRDNFKARALFLLLMPHSSCNPFYWGKSDDNDLNVVLDHVNFAKGLSVDLLRFTLELVVKFRKILIENKDIIIRKSSSGEEYDTFYYYCRNAIFQYDKHLLELLALFPDKNDKEIVFNHYSLLEPIPYDFQAWDSCGLDRSYYEPFGRLLERNDIDKEWKYRADDKMRKIISDEISGKKRPREEWEDALVCYNIIIGYQAFNYTEGQEGYYSKRLFVKQVKFLINRAMATGRYNLISNYDLKKLFEALGDNRRYKGIRYELAQYFVIKTKQIDFYCHDTEYELAKIILAEFGEKNEGIKIILEKIMANRRDTIAEIAKKNKDYQKSESFILNQMK